MSLGALVTNSSSVHYQSDERHYLIHRIVTYRFSDLDFIVRHETDGYVDAGKTPSNSKHLENGSLSSMPGSLSPYPTYSPPDTTPTRSKLTVREQGQFVSVQSALEIRTRVSYKPLETRGCTAVLGISNFKLVRAYHHRGTFQRLEIEDVAALSKGWKERNLEDLRKLAVLIAEILGVVKGCGRNAGVKIRCQGK